MHAQVHVGDYGRNIIRIRSGFTGTITASDVFLRDPSGNVAEMTNTFPGPRTGDIDIRVPSQTFDEPGGWALVLVIYSGSAVYRTPVLPIMVGP